jgi:hypothetical protein
MGAFHCTRAQLPACRKSVVIDQRSNTYGIGVCHRSEHFCWHFAALDAQRPAGLDLYCVSVLLGPYLR